jgi:hypothetical protein
VSIFQLLIQFVFRFTLGMSLAMAATPPRWVTSGFYRVHLWVLMGMNTLAALTLSTQQESLRGSLENVSRLLTLGIGLAVLSYAGSVCWLYEQVRAGRVMLGLLAATSLAAAFNATPWDKDLAAGEVAIGCLDLISSSLLLGVTATAMFLGHWYLNTPTMQLRPLRRLILAMMAAVLLRGLVSGAGLFWHSQLTGTMHTTFWIFVGMRWLCGLVGTFLLAVMAWYTLKVPNTQSATGILYAGVVLALIGELTSQFLSVDARYPL